MSIVNMLEAKTRLSKLVDSLESGQETEIIIARNGRPAARLVPLGRPHRGKRIGAAEGRWLIPDDIDLAHPRRHRSGQRHDRRPVRGQSEVRLLLDTHIA